MSDEYSIIIHKDGKMICLANSETGIEMYLADSFSPTDLFRGVERLKYIGVSEDVIEDYKTACREVRRNNMKKPSIDEILGFKWCGLVRFAINHNRTDILDILREVYLFYDNIQCQEVIRNLELSQIPLKGICYDCPNLTLSCLE